MLPLPHSMLYCGGEPRHCPQVMTVLPTASAKPKLPHSFNRCQTSVINTKTTRTTQKQGCVILVHPKASSLRGAVQQRGNLINHTPVATNTPAAPSSLILHTFYSLVGRIGSARCPLFLVQCYIAEAKYHRAHKKPAATPRFHLVGPQQPRVPNVNAKPTTTTVM